MQQVTRYIWTTFQKEGLHSYPAALTDPKLVDVAFLGYKHRHNFCFRVAIEVEHSERDIEFIQFKRWLQSLYNSPDELDLDDRSCETIADELYVCISHKYPGRNVIISIAEDGESGCENHYFKELH